MTRAVVVINPLSGRGRYDNQIQAHAALARDVLGAAGIDAEVRPTTAAGDARRFAIDALQHDRQLVVVWGGDGTINEAASALVGTNVPLAIVPAGSGNGLASDLAVPFEPRRALAIAAAGRTIAIDAARVDDCYFFNIAGVGIDAVIAARFAERGLRRRGPIAYLQLSSAELLRYRAKRYELELDGVVRTDDAMLLALANGRQYGNRVLIAPGARLDDGLLEVVIVEQLSLLSIAARLPSLFRGTLRPGPGVTMTAAREIVVRSPGEIPYHVDGEPRVGRDVLTVRTFPGALRVRVPAA
jgi:YegS/Rv2252/BmrU family lipid kinase